MSKYVAVSSPWKSIVSLSATRVISMYLWTSSSFRLIVFWDSNSINEEIEGSCYWMAKVWSLCCTYILLTKREGRTRTISAQGLDSRDSWRVWRKRKGNFYVKASSFRNVSHKTTRKSSRVIMWDHQGQCPVHTYRILDRKWSNLIGWF